MNGWQNIATLWHWESPVWFVAIALAVAYGLAFRGAAGRRVGFLVVALAALVLAFVSPIGVLADGYLFSAHMVQHLILLLVVPLFLMLSLPPTQVRRLFGEPEHGGTDHDLGSGTAMAPVLGWLCGIGAMWFWHVPSLCSAAAQSASLGIVRDATFLVAGLAFWLPIYAPLEKLRIPPLTAVTYLFSACLGCTLLGIYITFTTLSVCPAFASPVDQLGVLPAIYAAGLTPAADQHLGGLLMWVPPCSLYVVAIISVLVRWHAVQDEARGAVTVTTAVPHLEGTQT